MDICTRSRNGPKNASTYTALNNRKRELLFRYHCIDFNFPMLYEARILLDSSAEALPTLTSETQVSRRSRSTNGLCRWLPSLRPVQFNQLMLKDMTHLRNFYLFRHVIQDTNVAITAPVSTFHCNIKNIYPNWNRF